MEAHGETGGYRPVSRLAVAALVAGVVSSLALTTPLLWILPLVGIAVAAAALLDVARPGAEKAGRAAALFGLALAVGFGMQAVASKAVARWLTRGRVVAVTNAWLDAVVEGRLADARSMLGPDVLPLTDPSGHGGPTHAGHEHEGHDDAGHEHGAEDAAVAGFPAVQAIRSCGAAAARRVECTGRDEEVSERWTARLRLEPCAGGQPVELALQLVPSVVRDRRGSVERWTITKIAPGR
jgi:hypothetical protein